MSGHLVPQLQHLGPTGVISCLGGTLPAAGSLCSTFSQAHAEVAWGKGRQRTWQSFDFIPLPDDFPAAGKLWVATLAGTACPGTQHLLSDLAPVLDSVGNGPVVPRFALAQSHPDSADVCSHAALDVYQAGAGSIGVVRLPVKPPVQGCHESCARTSVHAQPMLVDSRCIQVLLPCPLGLDPFQA